MWSAAILTGGLARRLGGQDKSALIVDGVGLLDRQLATLRPLTESIRLVGYRGLGTAACPVVEDLRPGTGALGALFTALVGSSGPRVFVLAGDMPFVTQAFVEYLVDLDPDARAVVPVAGDHWHPFCAVYHRSAAHAIGAALDRGERTVSAAVAALAPRLVGPDEVARFDPDGRLLANLNTPADLTRWGVTTAREARPHDSRGVDGTAPIEASQTTRR